ncbi:hypothetical protein OGATHE_001446 [Ogataea polymorpha]|uniref:Uncharacterized protein n=1 Tax=Ogataea polymorpha TaxID=460523 RepID=A0A9P8TFY8_9ASCO|nr:hypothetical protein OGATHE_001446 [Ogataea polymorpha]
MLFFKNNKLDLYYATSEIDAVLGLLSSLSSPVSSRGGLSPVSVGRLSSPFSLSSFGSTLSKLVSKLISSRRLVCWFFRVSVKVQVWHNSPWLFSIDESTSESQNFSGEQPPNQTSGVLTLIVTWDSNIDVLCWRITVNQSDDWDVNVGGLLDGLGIGSWVCHND